MRNGPVAYLVRATLPKSKTQERRYSPASANEEFLQSARSPVLRVHHAARSWGTFEPIVCLNVHAHHNPLTDNAHSRGVPIVGDPRAHKRAVPRRFPGRTCLSSNSLLSSGSPSTCSSPSCQRERLSGTTDNCHSESRRRTQETFSAFCGRRDTRYRAGM